MNDINGNVTLMQFMDTLGNDNYAISILGYWIFDSNCEKSLCLKDADYDYILDEIECRDKIYFERNVSGNSDEEQY